MAIATFSQLLTAVSLWLDDNQYTASATDWITLGEKRIKRDLHVGQMEARATALTDTTTRFANFPAGLIQFRHLQLNSSVTEILEFVTPNSMNLFRSISAGKQTHYTLTANQIEFNNFSPL